MTPRYILKASGGNDSMALIQWARENGLRDVTVVYSDTGWAAPWWQERVELMAFFAEVCGFGFVRLSSVGFKDLVRKKKSFPRQGIQFCTEELKVAPSIEWTREFDPERQATVLVGKRREESSNRANTPEHVLYSTLDDGRRLWHPLFAHTEADRDALLQRAGLKPLPHRSDECFPCINSNRNDLRRLSQHPEIVEQIKSLEQEMGFTSKGKPRTMFRPYRYMGATGIEQIVLWAHSERGKFDPDDGTGSGDCYSGQCGL